MSALPFGQVNLPAGEAFFVPKECGMIGVHELQIFLARNKLRTCTCAQLKFREFIESPEGQQLIAGLLRSDT